MRLSPSGTVDALGLVHNRVLEGIRSGWTFLGQGDEGPDAYQQLCQALHSYIQARKTTKAIRSLWEEYPGAAALFLVLAGCYEYSQFHDEYWTPTFKAIGLPEDNISYQRRWGQPFLQFISIWGLSELDENLRPFVGRILGHAMLPNNCLPDFWENCIEPSLRSPRWIGCQPDELIRIWLADVHLTQPIEQFLKHGGRLAVRMVSEMRRLAQARLETGGILSSDTVQLPVRVVQSYASWVHSLNEKRYQPRIPRLQLDHPAGLNLLLPEQRLDDRNAHQVLTWFVLPDMRGPSKQTERHGSHLILASDEMIVPPDLAYTVELRCGKETLKQWSLPGIGPSRPYKIFSDRTQIETPPEPPLRPEWTWFVLPLDGSLVIRGPFGQEQPEIIQYQSPLMEEWGQYQAIRCDLSKAARVEIRCLGYHEDLSVVSEQVQVDLVGGDLLQSAEYSPDQMDLYGESPPQLVVSLPLASEDSILDNLVFRFDAPRSPDRNTVPETISGREFAAISQRSEQKFILDLSRWQDRLSPADVQITVVQRGKQIKRLFRWMPGLRWHVTAQGPIEVQVPGGARAQALGDGSEGWLKDQGGIVMVPRPEERYRTDVEMQWRTAGKSVYQLPLRLEWPHWAGMSAVTTSPVWTMDPLKIPIAEMLQAKITYLLFEAHNRLWEDAGLQAEWQVPGRSDAVMKLPVERLGRHGRWRISLSPLSDSLRSFQQQESQVGLLIKHSNTISEKYMLLHIELPSLRNKDPHPEPKPDPTETDIPPYGLLELGWDILCLLYEKPLSIHMLALEVNTSTRLAVLALNAVVPRYPVIRDGNDVSVTKETLHRIHRDFDEWDRKRHE